MVEFGAEKLHDHDYVWGTPWLQCSRKTGEVSIPEEEVLEWTLRDAAANVAIDLIDRKRESSMALCRLELCFARCP